MDLKDKIKVMQAYLDGAKIDHRITTTFDPTWKLCSNPMWNWQNVEYRIHKDVPDSNRMTNRQFAEFIALGNGEFKYDDSNEVHTYYVYDEDEEDNPVDEDVVTRLWGERDWETPTEEMYKKYVTDITYSHRDIDYILDKVCKGEKFI